MKLNHLILAVLCTLCACTSPVEQTANYRVVPLPKSIEMQDNAAPFVLNGSTRIVCANDSLVQDAEFLKDYINNLTGQDLKIVGTPTENAIILQNNLDSDNLEAYEIKVDKDNIVINGATTAGTFYGIQTLRKSIPMKLVKSIVNFPAATISDMPRFTYRGVHLDVARHPMEVDSVKAFIDMIALHNINHLHWHLTDDQGWRIEIKKYPKLTEVGSHRDGTMIERNWNEYDSIPVDGYYTQEEARDIIKYAADRHITIIPEIDLPGHMLAALAAYPQLGCTGGPYEVWKRWGISDDLLCAGNDSIYTFLDDVLSEIADIFPSEYIHIGGDECPKIRWEECPKCQAKIKELGLKTDANSSAEAKLQSYVMAHAQETLKRHGRKVIGWDEILEGGAPDDAVIMSWRGVDGALTACRTGRDAILTPTQYMYFDYCQSRDRDSEPVSIGNYLPVEVVYSFNPTPDGLTEQETDHIIGVQANLWREFIKTLSHSQYMELPRLAALSEVQWMELDQKDYADFIQRVQQLIRHYDALGYNYARHIYDINAEVVSSADDKAIIVTLNTNIPQAIYYTTDGTDPDTNSTLYTEPIKLTESCKLLAVAVDDNCKRSHVYRNEVKLSKSSFCPYTLDNEPYPKYAGNTGALTDGLIGNPTYSLPEWVGINGKDIVATINLGTPQEISSVEIRNFVDTPNWIFDIRGLSVEVSLDGTTYQKVAEENYPAAEKHMTEISEHTITFTPVEAKYVKVTAGCEKSIPAFHGSGTGKAAFVFADEISVN